MCDNDDMTRKTSPTTKTVTLRNGDTITLYWSNALGWVTIPERDEDES